MIALNSSVGFRMPHPDGNLFNLKITHDFAPFLGHKLGAVIPDNPGLLAVHSLKGDGSYLGYLLGTPKIVQFSKIPNTCGIDDPKQEIS
jgi:hypothetical protein